MINTYVAEKKKKQKEPEKKNKKNNDKHLRYRKEKKKLSFNRCVSKISCMLHELKKNKEVLKQNEIASSTECVVSSNPY